MTDPFHDLSVSTPERVALSVQVAGVGSRALAYLVDFFLLLFTWVALYFFITFLTSDLLRVFRGFSGVGWAVFILAIFAFQWVYWTASEMALGGQSLGKRVAGIRVVRADGAPVGFFESAIRNLLRVVDFLPAGYTVGVISLLMTERHQRLGDLAAGTWVVRVERATLERYSPPVDAEVVEARVVGASRLQLSSKEAELILGYLERRSVLDEAHAERLLKLLLERFAPAEQRAALMEAPPLALHFLRRLALGESAEGGSHG